MDIKQLILTTSGLLLAGIVEAQSAHPNVILIYTDDHGSLDVNCFGAKDLLPIWMPWQIKAFALPSFMGRRLARCRGLPY